MVINDSYFIATGLFLVNNSYPAFICITIICSFAYDKMVMKFYIHDPCRLVDFVRQAVVSLAGMSVSRRMVVHQHQRIRQFFDGPLDDQPVIHDGSRNAPLADPHPVDHPVRSIEINRPELFVRQRAELRLEHRDDILIGTQMIVKGHDFPDVTLVGVLAADLSLHVGDYRAAERTFQLLTQAAGRAGRGNKPGEVVIQTYDPEHYSIETAKAQDYDAFYEQEIAYRKIMLYPPVWNMLVILCASKSEEAADAMAAELVAAADAYTGKNMKEKVYLVGPVDAAIAKVNDIYKKIIYLKAENYDTLVKIKNRTEVYARESRYYKNVTVMFDFNPVNGF